MTDTYIAYVAYVNATTGEINRIDLANAVIPNEGVSEVDSSEHIVHIDSDYSWPAHESETSNRVNFMEKYYWSFSSSSWERRGPRPNIAGTWDGTEWSYDAEAWLNHIRLLRNEKLASTDWTQMPDAALTPEVKTAWATYRQALRDVPIANANVVAEADITWPTPPE